jgi:hypothetical protein
MQASSLRSGLATTRSAPAPARRVAVAAAAAAPAAEAKAPKESRIGKAPIPVPSGATVTLEDAYIKVKVRLEMDVVWWRSRCVVLRTGRGIRRRRRCGADAILWPRRRALFFLTPLSPSLPVTRTRRAPRASWNSSTRPSSRSKRCVW